MGGVHNHTRWCLEQKINVRVLDQLPRKLWQWLLAGGPPGEGFQQQAALQPSGVSAHRWVEAALLQEAMQFVVGTEARGAFPERSGAKAQRTPTGHREGEPRSAAWGIWLSNL